MKRLIILLCLIFQTLSCFAGSGDVSEANHVIDIDAPLPPLDVSSVKVYTYKPSPDAKLVGKIFARGMATVDRPGELDIFGMLEEATSPTRATEEDDKRLAMEALLLDAASIGADAVVIVKSYQARVSANATERRIEALAFKTPSAVNRPPTSPSGSSSGQNCSLSALCTLQRSR
ncbi:MAG: hypothetical protein DI585_07395 [Pseudomonas fluorescens]|nr:MAG: hypothetical protein DI585_07395 [Pseudomonas fluorescens]